MPFTSDPVWDPINATGQSTLDGAKTAYLMLNLTNMSLLTGQNPNAFWHSTSHLAMCQVYQEFLYQTTYLSLDMVMDSIIRESGRPSIQQVQTVAKIVLFRNCGRSSSRRWAASNHQPVDPDQLGYPLHWD